MMNWTTLLRAFVSVISRSILVSRIMVGAKTTATLRGVICDESVTWNKHNIRKRDLPGSRFVSGPHEQDGKSRIPGSRDV